MSLVLEEVTVRRGVGPVISDVSLEIVPGEITTIVGPNGAGKTSLLEAISGVVTTVNGRITMDDVHDVRKLSRRGRARLGINHVEQGRMIFPSLTVRENLKLTARTKVDLDESLALFPELEKRLDNATVLLSGEQQMVVLARAFAAKPKYLLLDEMSLGLAPVVFLRLLPTIQQIAQTGVGVLLIEQFAHLALGVASHAVVVTGGRVTYNGTPAALLEDSSLLREAYLG
ncbi:ABC transporter ATP-binding protein [Microbacterium sp. NPDC055357]